MFPGPEANNLRETLAAVDRLRRRQMRRIMPNSLADVFLALERINGSVAREREVVQPEPQGQVSAANKSSTRSHRRKSWIASPRVCGRLLHQVSNPTRPNRQRNAVVGDARAAWRDAEWKRESRKPAVWMRRASKERRND